MNRVDELREKFTDLCTLNGHAKDILCQLIEAAKAEERERCARVVKEFGEYDVALTRDVADQIVDEFRSLK